MAKVLLELKRSELLRKGKNEDPRRFARRLNYVNTIKPQPLARDLFIKTGTLTMPAKVGDYIVTIHISSILKSIREELDASNKLLPDRPLVYRALRKAIDTSNVFVDCTCPDFRYRFAYWSTKKKYKYGTPESRPSNITNPHNTGYACKHVTAALVRPSQQLKFVAGWISTCVKQYLIQELNLTDDDVEIGTDKAKATIGDINPKVIRDKIDKIENLDNTILDGDDDNDIDVEGDE